MICECGYLVFLSSLDDISHVQYSMLFRYDLYSAGNRYSQVNYGLLIRNITEDDNGIYTCCAEVQSTGALSQRDIEVIVYCKFCY